jgi:transcriptional regulator with XRE-family HTH domain
MMKVVIDGVIYVPRIEKVKVKGDHPFPIVMKEIRKAIGYTLDDSAKYIGCSKSYLWGMENGKNEPSLRMAMKICSTYGMQLERLALSLSECPA